MTSTKPISWLLVLLAILFAVPSFAQEGVEEEIENLPVDRPRSFQLVFNAGLMLNTAVSNPENTLRSYVNTGNSGSFFLGAGFMLHMFKNNLGIRIAPGVSWSRIAYDPGSDSAQYRQYPDGPRVVTLDTVDFNLYREKHNLTYFEVPIGVFWNITKDEDGDSRIFLEAGGYVGYKIGSRYTGKYESTENNRAVKIKYTNIPEIQDVRYGLYFRGGYQWIALYLYYRMSDVYDKQVASGDLKGSYYPQIPPFELGLTILL